jgi:lipoate-protein ligase A
MVPGTTAGVADHLDFIVSRQLSPRRRLAADRRVLAEVAATRTGVLRVDDMGARVLALGRYHACPQGAADVALFRRQSGGRAVAAGEGFVGVSLALPHRAALIADDPLALTPVQVMNRYVRGLLEGCKSAGVAAFYPGLDVVTVNRRMLALVGFEVAPSGAMLFEAVMALTGDFASLPRLLDLADPAGDVPARVLEADETTSLARELGRVPDLEEIAGWMRRGYEERLGVGCVEQMMAMEEVEPAVEAEWLSDRRAGATLDRRGTVATLLGTLDARFALAGGRITDIVFTGDFLADSAAIEGLEQSLRGCVAERKAIDAVVQSVFADPRHFVLGIGPATNFVEAVMRGVGA